MRHTAICWSIASPFGLAMVLAASLVLLAPNQVAAAETCGPEEIVVGGERAAFRWLALTKARANWRARVRRMPSLGPDYADWRRARDLVERCLVASGGVVCEVRGTPCKR